MKSGWEVKSFEECLDDVVYTKKIQKKDFLNYGEYPIISQEKENINGYWNDSADLFKIRKPIVVFGDHTQVVKFINFDFVLGADGVKILQPIDELNPKFFYYYMINTELEKLGYARHYRLLKEKIIAYPPLPEQQRIVDILDEAFEAVEKAKENVERNTQNLHTLLESYLQSLFANPGVGWEENSFEDCIENVIYTNKIKRNEFLDHGKYPIVSQEKEYINGYWNDQSDLFKIKKPVVIFGDHTQVLKYIYFDFVIGADGVKILQPTNNLHPKFFYYFMTNIKLKKLGYARHYRLLKDKKVSFPCLSEQCAIVEKLDALSAETKKLEAIYNQKLADLDELKKSILQKAFNGEL